MGAAGLAREDGYLTRIPHHAYLPGKIAMNNTYTELPAILTA